MKKAVFRAKYRELEELKENLKKKEESKIIIDKLVENALEPKKKTGRKKKND